MLYVKYIIFAVCMLILVKIIIKKEPTYLAYWFLPLFMFAWKMLSLVYLETGVYAVELYRQTYQTGADYVFLLLMSVFFAVGIASAARKHRGIRTRNKPMQFTAVHSRFISWAVYAHIVVLIYLYVNFALVGFSAFNNLLDFHQQARLPFVSQFGSTLTYFLLTVDGLSFFCLKRKRKTCFALYLFSCIYMFMAGSKFTGLFQYTVFFFAPLYFAYAANGKIKLKSLFKPKVILPILTLLVALLVIAFFRYSETSSNAMSLLISRIFDMQAGTMWSANEYITRNNIAMFGDMDQLVKEIEALFAGTSELDGSIGLGHVMYLSAPSYIVDTYLENGLRFSGWFLAVSYISMGYVGSLILCALLGLIFSQIMTVMDIAFREGSVLLLALSTYEYISFFDYYRIGNFSYFFNPLNIVLLLIMLVIIFMKKRRIKLVLRRRRTI